jgi:outer membrane protein assembly factor BamC
MSAACRLLTIGLAALLAAGCSAIDSINNASRIDYKSTGKLPPLEIPPELVSPRGNERFAIPERTQAQTLSGFQTARAADRVTSSDTSRVLPAAEGVRMARNGSQRWLVVEMPPERVYPLVREFWQESGFLIGAEQPSAGILETDWAENRAKVPQDIIRSTIGRVFDNLYSTGERDKFRTRLESSEAGRTEVYITHRGLAEIYTDRDRSRTVWSPRPADPELEAEFLAKLMVKLGVDQQRARAQVASVASVAASAAPAGAATAAEAPRARRMASGEGEIVVVAEPFDRAWRRVGLALDRGGFTVEDRDRSQGVYDVRYIDPEVDAKSSDKPGLFARVFKTDKRPTSAQSYRIRVRAQGEETAVSVLQRDGQPLRSDADRQTGGKIVGLLHEQLR